MQFLKFLCTKNKLQIFSVSLTTIPHKDTFYTIGDKITITCNANTKVIGEIKWYTKKGDTEEEVVEDTGVLEIENVRFVLS